MSTKFKALKPNPLAKITNPGGFPIPNYTYRTRSIRPSNLLAYWPMSEPSGTTMVDESGNGRNGAYTSITLGQDGIGDNRTSGSLNGATAVANLFSVSLHDAFNGSSGTMMVWSKVPDLVTWESVTVRTLFMLGASATSSIEIRHGGVASDIRLIYIAGGTVNTLITSTTTTNWFNIIGTWNGGTGNVSVAYLNGTQFAAGSTLGTWANQIGSGSMCVGVANLVGTRPWSGFIAHAALWNVPLDLREVQFLAKN